MTLRAEKDHIACPTARLFAATPCTHSHDTDASRRSRASSYRSRNLHNPIFVPGIKAGLSVETAFALQDVSNSIGVDIDLRRKEIGLPPIRKPANIV